MTNRKSRGTLMVQGTTSDAGKSTLVAGLCRVLARKGVSVAPFKPQNMALNSAVTDDGGEIGRAQALQAYACNIAPHVDMNPILLKPTTDIGAQVIVQGKALTNMQASDYQNYKKVAKDAVFDSYNRLKSAYDWVMVEGAGSPAEINLRHNDIANMGFAEEADCPVIIIADIDKGGVFAHLVGTLALLSKSEQQRVIGFVINRFRGDINLLTSGLDWLEDKTGKPVFGVLPYLHGLYLDAEDGINPIDTPDKISNNKRLTVVIPGLPRISNHTDFDPLRLHPDVNVHFVREGEEIPPADLIIIPGSKSVIADLNWMRQQGWEDTIKKHLRYGGKLIGICGGFQMLGKSISDPFGIEGPQKEAHAFNLLPISTELKREKQLLQSEGLITLIQNLNTNAVNAPVKGYEIHAGVTNYESDSSQPLVFSDGRSDGFVSEDNQIMGTYLHGLFDAPEACDLLLRWAGSSPTEPFDFAKLREKSLNRLADSIEQSMDINKLLHAVISFKDSRPNQSKYVDMTSIKDFSPENF